MQEGPISYCFRDKRRFRSNMAFFHPLLLRDFPWEFCDGGSALKYGHVTISQWKELMRSLSYNTSTQWPVYYI